MDPQHCQAKTVAKKSARLKTFPDCLLLSLSKYQMDQNWQPVKLNVEVSVKRRERLSAPLSLQVSDGSELAAGQVEC